MAQRSQRVNFWRGLHSDIPSEIVPGRLLYEQDTGDVFLDFTDQGSTGQKYRVQLSDSRKFNISGGTFTGSVILDHSPVQELEAATKIYVDDVSYNLDAHISDRRKHITQEERIYWNNKVDSETGKGLSTNDFTDAFLVKLSGIADSANKVEFESTVLEEDTTTIGELTIVEGNGSSTTYAVVIPNIHNVDTASALATSTTIDGIQFNGTENVVHYGLVDEVSEVMQVDIPNYQLINGGKLSIEFTDSITSNNVDNEYYFDVSGTGQWPIYIKDIKAPIEFVPGIYEFIYHDGLYEYVGGVLNQYLNSTTSNSGLMSAEDKTKLDNIDPGANAYILPEATEDTLGGIKIGDNINISDGSISIDSTSVIEALSYTPLGPSSINRDNLVSEIGVFNGATSYEIGTIGLVPAPQVDDTQKFLKGDGSWSTVDVDDAISSINNSTIDLIVSGNYDGLLYRLNEKYVNPIHYEPNQYNQQIYDQSPIYHTVCSPTDSDILEFNVQEPSELGITSYAMRLKTIEDVEFYAVFNPDINWKLGKHLNITEPVELTDATVGMTFEYSYPDFKNNYARVKVYASSPDVSYVEITTLDCYLVK